VQAVLPARPIDKGRPGPVLLAHVVASKYADHLPLYRREQIFERHGVQVTRRTLSEWNGAVADLLEPLVRVMHREQVRQSSWIQWTTRPRMCRTGVARQRFGPKSIFSSSLISLLALGGNAPPLTFPLDHFRHVRTVQTLSSWRFKLPAKHERKRICQRFDLRISLWLRNAGLDRKVSINGLTVDFRYFSSPDARFLTNPSSSRKRRVPFWCRNGVKHAELA